MCWHTEDHGFVKNWAAFTLLRGSPFLVDLLAMLQQVHLQRTVHSVRSDIAFQTVKLTELGQRTTLEQTSALLLHFYGQQLTE